MPEYRIDSAEASNLSNAIQEFTIDSASTDGASEQKETIYVNDRWETQLGLYKNTNKLNEVIDTKSRWTVGKGFKTDLETKRILDGIKGFGKDTFNTVIENQIRTYHIGGDAYAEIIRNENNELINIKPLDPGVMKHVAKREGIIIRYEQISKVNKGNKKFDVKKILHFSRNRIADEIHGISMVDKLEKNILRREEAMADIQILMRRNVKPIKIWKLDTDDPAEIKAFKDKIDVIQDKTENIFVPKDLVEVDIISVAPNQTLNPLPWLEYLDDEFYEAAGVPRIVIGNGKGFTDASGKVGYLAFEQGIREEQLYIVEQIGMQLGIALVYEFPASLEADLISDEKKDGKPQAAQPNDTNVTMGGNT